MGGIEDASPGTSCDGCGGNVLNAPRNAGAITLGGRVAEVPAGLLHSFVAETMT